MTYLDPIIADRIRGIIESSDVVLFMKGTPVFPQCSGSALAVQILNILGVKFMPVDVLTDAGVRHGIKDFTNWPMLPQLYVKGEFIGSPEIMREMLENGELQKLFAARGIDFEPHLQRA